MPIAGTLSMSAPPLSSMVLQHIEGGHGGGGDGDGGGGGSMGGVTIGSWRTPQSRQSLPKVQSLYSAPGPPSSHSLSYTYWHVLPHTPGGSGGGGVGGSGGGGGGFGGDGGGDGTQAP